MAGKLGAVVSAIEEKAVIMVAGLAAVAVIGVMLVNKAKDSLPDSAAAAGESLGGAAADLVTGTAAGLVNHAANAFGIPMQDDAQCIIDLKNGDTLRAMSTCRIGTFAQYLYDGTIPT